MTCRCGRPATHRVPVPCPSLRGTAIRYERGCVEHASRIAATLLLEGLDAVEVEAIPMKEETR